MAGHKCVGHCEIDKFADMSYRAMHGAERKKRQQMKIEIGKYTLISDSQCYWITRKYKTKKNTEGKLRVSGYARTFEELIHSFMECRLRDSDAENLKDLMHDVENIKQDAEEIVKEYFKNYRA